MVAEFGSVKEAGAWLSEQALMKPRPDLLPLLQEALINNKIPSVVDFLEAHLSTEYINIGDYSSAEILRSALAKRRPDDPITLLGMAELKQHYQGDAASAVMWAKRAVKSADKVRRFRRHSRATLVRAAGDLGNVGLMESCLLEITNLELEPNETDVGKEKDLLYRARRAGVNKNILYIYQIYLEQN